MPIIVRNARGPAATFRETRRVRRSNGRCGSPIGPVANRKYETCQSVLRATLRLNQPTDSHFPLFPQELIRLMSFDPSPAVCSRGIFGYSLSLSSRSGLGRGKSVERGRDAADRGLARKARFV